MNTYSFYHGLASLSIVISLISLASLAISLSTIYIKSDFEVKQIELQSNKFKVSTDSLWTDLMSIRSKTTNGAQFFSRQKRQEWLGGGFCRGCFTLACPSGMPGPPGMPGPDGTPGDAGKNGHTGDDGYDVQLETEPDLPCVVCPAGPPGTRGSQGERGLPGHPGLLGMSGPDGSAGMDGPPGLGGPSGTSGPIGPRGAKGPDGDTVVAGFGVKGPVGPPGPQGMKGRPGAQGKGSNNPGSPGSPGPAGPLGQTGKQGSYGQEGQYGPPGDPGMPASYCPSDCGVQNILAEVASRRKTAETNDVTTEYPRPGKFESLPSFHSGEFPQAPQITDSYNAARLHDFAKFERKLRRKMMKRMMKLRTMKL